MSVSGVNVSIKTNAIQTYTSILPWTASDHENKRFKQILAVVLFITLMLAAGVKWQELPEQAVEKQYKPPPQFTRLIKPVKIEKPKPKIEPKPIPTVKEPEPEKRPVPPKTEVVQESKKVDVPSIKVPTEAEKIEKAKQKAKQSGLLALQDDLASMHQNNNINNLANTNSIKGAGTTDDTQRKFVGKLVNNASGGLDASKLSQDIGAKGEFAERKDTEYLAPTEGFASIATQQENAGDTAATGGRSVESIRQVLDANKGGIYAIYRRALRSDASLQGKITVNIQIGADGSVLEINIVFSELGSQALEQNVVNRIKLINFGPQNVSKTSLDYSFNFLPF